MPFLISRNQSTFISSRLITNYILLAHELLHCMKRKKHENVGRMTVKLDMSKAYDSVEWGYLRVVMWRMSFWASWINPIMSCVFSVQYMVLVNRKPGQTIIPSRWLIQGDPLLPYRLLLCVESFSSMVNQAKLRGDIRGANVTRGWICINHLLFANGCVLFSKATRQEWIKL